MKKITTCVIDDVIWLFRDLTRNAPKSMFEHPFLAMLKEAHEKYGFKVQLNLFYQLDNYYGNDEFSLKEMTDVYKAEWEAASDWLIFGFHSKQEFPDYPYINANYEHVKEDFLAMQKEVYRFASPKNWSKAVLNHWRPMSKEGCQALCDCGVQLISATVGKKEAYDGNPASLPYGHAGRLLHNRKPETMIFQRNTKDIAILKSLCGYNHITEEEEAFTLTTRNYIVDEEIGIKFKNFSLGLIHNLSSLEGIREEMRSYIGNEYVGWGTHEQYFYPEYFAYQPEYKEKLMIACDELYNNGYQFIFMQDLI